MAHDGRVTPALKRLSLDLTVPQALLVRRGAISFGSCSSHDSKPRLQRRGAISFDKLDTSALYVRQLGDVRMKNQEEIIAQNILNNLHPEDRKTLEILALESCRPRLSGRFLTVSGMRRRRRCARATTHCQPLLDDSYNSKTACLLAKASDWSFDVFSLDYSSNGRPLFHMILRLFQKHNLIDHFDLDIVKLMKFASLVEEGYHQNPYHNAIHAADVTQAMHCYIMQEKIAKHLSPLETMITLISAITHDLDHPGVNQAFLIATFNHLASLYKETSVLENHHWRSAVGLLRESALLDHLPDSVWPSIEKQMKSLILATDMTRQQEFFSRLKKHVADDDLDLSRFDHRHFILQIALKCADISNPCREWSVCKRWSKRVCDEFFQQGDYERKLSLPITNLCDRSKHSVPSIQTGFIDFVVEPLFKEFGRFMQSDLLTEQMDNLLTNRDSWQQVSSADADDTPSLSLTIDINSNIESVSMQPLHSDDADSGTESDVMSSPVSTGSSEADELPAEITDIHTDIAIVADRLDWTDSDRRHSLPNPLPMQADIYARRKSFPRVQAGRRSSLPQTSVHQAISFDRLVEKLTLIENEIAPNMSTCDFDNLMTEPRLSTLSPSIETSKITRYLVRSKFFPK